MKTAVALGFYVFLWLSSIAGFVWLSIPLAFESDGWTPIPIRAVGQAYAVRGQGEDQFLPDPKLTPGAVWKEATLSKILQPLYSKSVRDVPESEKKKVFERYGIDYSKHAGFEVDHLCPLSWGGSNDLSNLWPQSYSGQWNAHVKDALEVHGLMLIRDGKLELHAAQKEIADDWIGMYQRLLGHEPHEAKTLESEQ